MDADGLIDGRGTQCTSRFLRSTPTKEETEMKMPRFFVVLGACALLLLACQLFSAQSSSADPLPVMRADPWAGDPEEPGFARGIPFDNGEPYTRIEAPYETSGSKHSITRVTVRSFWLRMSGLLFWAERRRL